jgi:1-pyrroline-5-carboxylate dehydrogenase
MRTLPAANEPVRSYPPGSPERHSLQAVLARMSQDRIELPAVIDGKDVRSGGTAPRCPFMVA